MTTDTVNIMWVELAKRKSGAISMRKNHNTFLYAGDLYFFSGT